MLLEMFPELIAESVTLNENSSSTCQEPKLALLPTQDVEGSEHEWLLGKTFFSLFLMCR